VLGVGFGVVNPPITSTAVSGMPPEQAGVAGAIASTSRQIGNVLGVAIMGTMVSSTVLGPRRLSPQAGAAFASATHVPWMLATACGLACAAIAATCAGPRGLRAAAAIYREQPPAD
jgi:predicted MFS family arabinose efflux permease